MVSQRKGDNTYIKDQNIRNILFRIRMLGTTSRAALSRDTRMSRSTVTLAVDELLERGLIEEIGVAKSSLGRRPMMVRIKKNGRLVMGLHVKDDGSIALRLADLTGNAIYSSEAPGDSQPAAVRQQCWQLYETLCPKLRERIDVICFALPGTVDQNGKIVSAVHLRWENVELLPFFVERLKIVCVGGNATSLAAYSEIAKGQWYDKTLFYIRLDKTVGAGIVSNNRLHYGVRGSAAEIGHTVIDRDGDLCQCGRLGCLETRVSRKAVFKSMAKQPNFTSCHPNVCVDNIFEWLIEQGTENSSAANELGEIAGWLGKAIVNVLNVLGQDVTIVESELSSNRLFWNQLVATVNREATLFPERDFSIIPGPIGGTPALDGALAYAEEYFFQNFRASDDRLTVRQKNAERRSGVRTVQRKLIDGREDA